SQQSDAPASATSMTSAASTEPALSKQSTSNGLPAKMSEGAASSSIGTGTTKSHASAGSLSEGEQVLWDTAVGISIVSRIKAKIKKGERPNLFEVLILVVHTLGTGLAWVAKQVWKMAKPVAKVLWKLLKDGVKTALKALGRTVYNLVRVVLVLAVLGLLGWFAWEFYKNGHHPREALATMLKTIWEWAVLLWRQG
ncbi:MAG TPA: hypothetical protein VK791_01420, partial [bacterium]|nr:hypothetical protein [bacterium]